MKILISITLSIAILKVSGNSDLLMRALRAAANDLPVVLQQAQHSLGMAGVGGEK